MEQYRHRTRGFSAIEVIVWIGIFVIVMVAVTSSIVYFYTANKGAINEANAVAGAQDSINAMMTAIRETGFSSNGAYPIISMAGNDLRFYAAVPNQTFVEEVHFYVATTTSTTSAAALYEGIIIPTGDPPSYANPEATSTLTSYVQNLAQGTSTFTYYDGNGNIISDYTQIQNLRFVTVNLILNVDPTNPHAVDLRSSAAMRNLVGH
jgi:type II secretory pathway pseudopilin PulG